MPKKAKGGPREPYGASVGGAPVPTHREGPYASPEPTEKPWDDVLHRLLAVDPGDVHVGIAEFVETSDSWECVRAYELDWQGGIDLVASHLEGGQLNYLVVENFRLYADEAKAQIGSEMLTSQCIGAIKYLHSLYERKFQNRHEFCVLCKDGQHAPARLELQPASIQKATAAICKGMGIESESKGNAHARSAELHGWHYILRHKLGNAEAAWAADGAK